MSAQLRLVYQGSPLMPQFDLPQVIDSIKQDLSPTFEHAAAIASTASPMMAVHACLLRQNPEVLSSAHISEPNLRDLIWGYCYPLSTILASAVCRRVSTRAKRLALYEQLLVTTHSFTLLRIQEQIATDLNATCNLLNLDPSGALVFRYLQDYPFSQEEFFQTGSEIAAMIFFGLSRELAKDLGDDSWLNVPYDPTIT